MRFENSVKNLERIPEAKGLRRGFDFQLFRRHFGTIYNEKNVALIRTRRPVLARSFGGYIRGKGE